MRIPLKKFGNILISRQAGKEAFATAQPLLKSFPSNEDLEVDFEGVVTFSPSWGDEFLTQLQKQFGERLKLINIGNNPSVVETLKILEQTSGVSYKVV